MTTKAKSRYTINAHQPCPKCGAKAVRAGELTFCKRGGIKWHGPYLEWECGLMVVAPGAGTPSECPPEFWNHCINTSTNGKPVVTIPESDYEIREGKPDPVPAWIEYRGRVFMYSTDGTSSSTTTL